MFSSKWKFVYQAVDAAGCSVLSAGAVATVYIICQESNFQIFVAPDYRDKNHMMLVIEGPFCGGGSFIHKS